MSKKSVKILDYNQINRREFLSFLGAIGLLNLVSVSCVSGTKKNETNLPFETLSPSLEDQLRTLSGISYSVFIKEGEIINKQGSVFGTHNDFIAVVPHEDPNCFYLVVNHESVSPILKANTLARDKKYVDEEMKSVGVSVLKIRKSEKGYEWIFDDKSNKRFDATTSIPLISARLIEKKKMAQGTFGNCSGGVTPWGTILSCEENFQNFVGDRAIGKRTIQVTPKNDFQWYSYYDMPPEHYGWVVEIDPAKGSAQKLTALGRMAHEGAKVTRAKDGRAVVYMGDDDHERCLYKFISSSTSNLNEGDLYVANVESGKWIKLSRDAQPILKSTYKDHTELLIYTREAAKMVGGSPLDRPEDIEIDPKTAHVFVALTNNEPKKRPHGSILKIIEDGSDHGSLTFVASQFILGGEISGISCPDNLAVDRNGNLWLTTDMSGKNIGKPEFQSFGNNSLFFIPLRGKYSGIPIRIATAPKDAEFTGPCFAPDGQSLFLSVQHPGETSKSLEELTSHWPDGGTPKSAIVLLSGNLFEYFLGQDFT
jgi:secreted PhoX family phosphatase